MQKILGSLTLSLLAPVAMGQCVSAGPAATSYGGGDDTVVNSGNGIDMGFAFPIGGVSYQFIHPSSNGFAWLSDGSAAITNSDLSPSAADFATDAARVAVLWDDLNLIAANGGDLLVDTSVTGQCTVTWANVVPFGQATQTNIQCTLYQSGVVDFVYDSTVYQVTDTIVGISPGNGVTQAASVDLSAGLPSSDDMTHELFPANSIDLGGFNLQLIGTVPGYVPVLSGAGCATKLVYGEGCVSRPDGVYELFGNTAGGTVLPDIMASGTTISVLRTGNEYTVIDSIPGTYLPPSAGATVVATGDDDFGTVALSAPMPVPGGVTNSLQVAMNGYVHLTDTVPAGNSDWSPTLAEFEAFADPTICGPWYDWSPNQAGQVVAEEIGGVVYVTWDQVQPFNGTATDTWQYQFDLASGNCTIVFDTMTFTGASTWHTPLFGASAGAATNVESTDWSASLLNGVTINDQGTSPLALDSNLPVLGTNWDLTTSNIDALSPISITVFGNAQGPGLPMTAIGFNAPGCSVWVDVVNGSLSAPSVGGTSVTVFPIPSNPVLQGFQLSAQSVCLTLANQANLLTSNGLLGTVGL